MKQKMLEQSILTSVFHLSNKLQAEGDKLSDELTLKQWFLLLLLYRGRIKNPTVNDLALDMGGTRQSVKKNGGYTRKKRLSIGGKINLRQPGIMYFSYLQNI